MLRRENTHISPILRRQRQNARDFTPQKQRRFLGARLRFGGGAENDGAIATLVIG
jgi:hypothetical protein